MLIFILTLLSFFSTSLPIILKPVWICFCSQSSEERNNYAEIIHYKAEQKSISMKDNFAAHAKLQRKINKLEDLQKELSQSRMAKSLKIKFIATCSIQIVLGIIMIFLAFWYRYTPIYISEQSLFPLQNIFSYPINIPNAISPHAWLVLSRISFSSLIKAS